MRRGRHDQRQATGPVARGELGGQWRYSAADRLEALRVREQEWDGLRVRPILDGEKLRDRGGVQSCRADAIDRVGRKSDDLACLEEC